MSEREWEGERVIGRGSICLRTKKKKEKISTCTIGINIYNIKFRRIIMDRLCACVCVCVDKIWYWCRIRLPSRRQDTPRARPGPSVISYHLSNDDGATHPSWIIFIKHWQPDRQLGSSRDSNMYVYICIVLFFLLSFVYNSFFLFSSSS